MNAGEAVRESSAALKGVSMKSSSSSSSSQVLVTGFGRLCLRVGRVLGGRLGCSGIGRVGRLGNAMFSLPMYKMIMTLSFAIG